MKIFLRIQRSQPITHECSVCSELKICHHRDLDFRTGGMVCDDCAEPVKNAEDALIGAHFAAPIDRALDVL